MDPGSDLLGWEQPNAAAAAAAKPKKKRRSSILKVPTNNVGNHREPLQVRQEKKIICARSYDDR